MMAVETLNQESSATAQDGLRVSYQDDPWGRLVRVQVAQATDAGLSVRLKLRSQKGVPIRGIQGFRDEDGDFSILVPYENEARLYIPFASIRYRGQGMALMVIQAGRVSEREKFFPLATWGRSFQLPPSKPWSQSALFLPLFGLFATIAHADEPLTMPEKAFIQGVCFEELGITEEEWPPIESLLEEGTPAELGGLVELLLDRFPDQTEFSLMAALIDLARCDGPINIAEYKALREVGRRFGLSPSEIERVGVKLGEEAMEPFRLLGVSPETELADIKKIYREEIARYHPDRHAQLPPDMREYASERSAELNSSWSEIQDLKESWLQPLAIGELPVEAYGAQRSARFAPDAREVPRLEKSWRSQPAKAPAEESVAKMAEKALEELSRDIQESARQPETPEPETPPRPEEMSADLDAAAASAAEEAVAAHTQQSPEEDHLDEETGEEEETAEVLAEEPAPLLAEAPAQEPEPVPEPDSERSGAMDRELPFPMPAPPEAAEEEAERPPLTGGMREMGIGGFPIQAPERAEEPGPAPQPVARPGLERKIQRSRAIVIVMGLLCFEAGNKVLTWWTGEEQSQGAVELLLPSTVLSQPAEELAPKPQVINTRSGEFILQRANYSMQKIEPGEFRMLTADGPPREVSITRAFEAGTTEVTHALWDEVMSSNPSIFERCGISCPVESVTWIKAVEFCNQLSKMSGYKSAYRFKDGQVLWISDSKGYRLPTEAEWEYMASQGDMLNRARSNPTLTYTDEKLMVNPAGSIEPNSWGIMDLEGNVGEWVWDFHGPIQSAPVKNPRGPGQGTERVYRGINGAKDRGALPPHQSNGLVGFRVVRSL